MKIGAVVPAFNEEAWIGEVIEVLKQCSVISEMVVVNDASTDGTSEVAAGHGVAVINLPHNVGKGGAMWAGAQHVDTEAILFIDADLIGLTPQHVEDLVRPVLAGEAEMSIGIFKGGRPRTDWAQKISPYISGQRAVLKKDFLAVPGIEEARYGAEIALGRYAREHGLTVVTVPMVGVTHPMKEEKLGFLRGTISRGVMYWQIMKLVVRYSRATNRLRRWLPSVFRTPCS